MKFSDPKNNSAPGGGGGLRGPDDLTQKPLTLRCPNFVTFVICELVTDRISNLKGHFKSPKCKVLDQPDVKDTLHKLHDNYVLVPVDKAANNVIIVCKKYYIDTLVKELGINNANISNPTYIPINDSFQTIVKSHNQFITSVGLEISEEDQNRPYLYWTPTLHKSQFKHSFIAGSSKCMTKDLSCLLTKVLSTIKDGLVLQH